MDQLVFDEEETESVSGFFGFVATAQRRPRRGCDTAGRAARVTPRQLLAELQASNRQPYVMTSDLGAIPLQAEGTQQALLAECDTGPVEYKLMLVDPSADRINHLCTQMNFRLMEGGGHAIYEVGVRDSGEPSGLSDDDLRASIGTIHNMASRLSCQCFLVGINRGINGKTARLLVERLPRAQVPVDVSVCMLGSTGAGKSTLIGVISNGTLDNGAGLARTNVFRHQHELVNGVTSCLSRKSIGWFGSDGAIANYSPLIRTLSDLVATCPHIVTMTDLALKTTLFGLTSQLPDYSCVTLSALTAAPLPVHLNISAMLRIPVFIVITKADLVSETTLQERIGQIGADLAPRRTCVVRETPSDEIVSDCVKLECVPIIVTSSKTGCGLPALQQFLSVLPKPAQWVDFRHQLTEFQCDETHIVANVGLVVSGMVQKGDMRVGQVVQLGPDGDGRWRAVRIQSIHVLRTHVERAVAGQRASVALNDVSRDKVHKGIALLHCDRPRYSCFQFTADISFLPDSSAVTRGCTCVVHVGSISQVCTVINVTGRLMQFRLSHRCKYISIGAPLIFRDGRVQGAGFVTAVEHAVVARDS